MQPNKIIIPAIILISFCICLTLVGGLGLGFGLSNTFKTAITHPAEPDTYEPPERPAPRGRLLLEDDFSQERWKVDSDDEYRKGYANGEYFIVVEAKQYNYWSLAGETYQDFVLEVETTQVDGPDNNDYGVILRHRDDANFYSFEISSDGFYTFTKLVDDQLFNVIPWQESEAINQGHSQNTLRIEAAGSNFTLYINDELVDVAIDSDLDEGDIGLIVGTGQETGTHVAFDNLKVWAME